MQFSSFRAIGRAAAQDARYCSFGLRPASYSLSITVPLTPLCAETSPQQWESDSSIPSAATDSATRFNRRNEQFAATSKLSRANHHSRCNFSTTTKPFSRKKPVKAVPVSESSEIVGEPLLSFNYQATLGIIQIARAVAPIVSMNEGYILTANYDLRTDAFELAGEKEPLSLELKTNGKGSYLFTIDRATERINLVSPMSGLHSYFFDQKEQLWLSMATDRHDLRGMVTRDLLRHARGLATF